MNLDVFTFKLAHGSHPNPESGTCFMEAVSWMAREPHSDAPKCACPVLGRFGILLNDRMTDEERKALNPLILKMMNTRSKQHEEPRAAYLLREVAVRILAPLLDARKWHTEAGVLRALPAGATRKELVAPLRAVRDLAYKRRAAAAANAAVAANAAAAAYAYAAANAAAAAANAAAYAAYAAKKFHSLWARETVAILSEAIEIGPHNSQEFYDTSVQERLTKFRADILQVAG